MCRKTGLIGQWTWREPNISHFEIKSCLPYWFLNCYNYMSFITWTCSLHKCARLLPFVGGYHLVKIDKIVPRESAVRVSVAYTNGSIYTKEPSIFYCGHIEKFPYQYASNVWFGNVALCSSTDSRQLTKSRIFFVSELSPAYDIPQDMRVYIKRRRSTFPQNGTWPLAEAATGKCL